MLQARLLFNLLAGPAEFALLEDDKQVAAEADSLPLLFCQPLLDEPCLALGKAFPDVRPEPIGKLLRLIAGDLAVQPCGAVMVRELFERPDRQGLDADRQATALLPFVAFRVCQMVLANAPTAIGLSGMPISRRMASRRRTWISARPWIIIGSWFRWSSILERP